MRRMTGWLLLAASCGGGDPEPVDTNVGDADTDADSDSDSDADADADTDTDADSDADAMWVRIDDSGGVTERSADAAIAPDGTIFVSWVDERNGAPDAYVRRSTDGGVSWSAAARVDDASVEPGVSMAREPYVTTDGTRVVVAFNDFTTEQVYVYSSPATGTLSFTRLATLSGVGDTFNDFPKAVIVDGEILVTWQTYDAGGRIVLARESQSWELTGVDADAPGQPCECCPLDILAGTSGITVAYRENDSNNRQHWVSHADAVDGEWVSSPATDNETALFTCPMEGPRLAEADGELYIAWATATGDNRTWVSRSADGGATWSDERDAFGFVDTSNPSIAATSEAVFVATQIDARSALAVSTDGGATFGSPVDLRSTDGDVGYAQLETNGTLTVAAGTSGDHAWLYVLP